MQTMLTKWCDLAQPGVERRDADSGAAPVTFVLSTDEVDRHGDVVAADGWVLDAYRRNPVLLWAHDYRRPAIGRAVGLWTEPRRLMARMEFAPTGFAQEVAALYRTGFQWGVSVGFKPLRFEERRDEKTGAFLGGPFPATGTVGGKRSPRSGQPQRPAARPAGRRHPAGNRAFRAVERSTRGPAVTAGGASPLRRRGRGPPHPGGWANPAGAR